VIAYAERPTKRGLVVMDTPGHDIEQMTAMAAGGAQIAVFTTGRGTPTGCPVVPVIKVATNSELFRRMRENMDLNAGTILSGRATVAGIGRRIFAEVMKVANGKLTNDRATEKSALKPGLDAQLEIDEGPLFDQLFTVSPYYQTDFRGIAQAYGFSASWEPLNYTWRLGGSYRWFSPLIDFFYQLKAEAVGLRVSDAGLTDLTSDRLFLAWRNCASECLCSARAFARPPDLDRYLQGLF
jgi:altronate dehydratase large subunit